MVPAHRHSSNASACEDDGGGGVRYFHAGNRGAVASPDSYDGGGESIAVFVKNNDEWKKG